MERDFLTSKKLISGGFWKRKFGSSPDAAGKTLTLNGVGYTVVGVIPADFRYQSGNFHNSDVYVPTTSFPIRWPRGDSR